jgi:hypothetical protein
MVREIVANTIYTAPPFAGSTAAIFAARLYEEDLEPSVFQDQWIRNGAGSLTLHELMIALTRSFAGPDAEEVAEVLLDFVPKPFGLDPTAVTIDQLATDPVLAASAVVFISSARDLVTGLIGFPGEPKVSQDLTPWGAVANLNQWQPNFNTKQFVTWGEGGGRINLTPSLETGKASYDAGGNCCGEFLDPVSLDLPNDDWALSHVSARLLATPEGGMVELEGYPSLWHGTINTEVETVGMDWVRTLVSPITALELNGPVPLADVSRRTYRVGPTTTFRFSPASRVVEDRFGDEQTVSATGIEYRIVTHDFNQTPTYFPWVQVDAASSESFGNLALASVDLAGERPFLLEWRAINQSGAKEAIRAATFSIDATPPSIQLVEVFTPGFEDSPEIVGDSDAPRRLIRRSNLLTGLNLPNLGLLIDEPEMDWIIRNPADKLLRIDFDEPGAIVRYQWDAFFTDPVVDTLLNVSLAFPLAGFAPGPHTLYLEVSDAAGNETNVVRAINILVDDQAPIVGLNYEGTGGLGFVVGPDTPLEFIAEDVETGVVTGELIVPGLGTVPVNSSFRLGETSIADAAEGTGVLGLIVNLQADVADAVGNTLSRGFDVYYDFSAPRLELQHVGSSVLLSDGTYRTTESTVLLEVRISDNAGYQFPTWTASKPGTDLLRSGAPMTFASRGGRPEANGAFVPLADGLNVIVVTVADLVGNTTSVAVHVEKAQTLIEDESNRPIELVSLHVEDAPTGGTGPSNVGSSDDGSVFVFDSSRRDHVPDDTNGERDIFVWRNSTVTRANTSESGAEAVGGESRNPTLSGNGQYAFFASEATNLVDEATSGVNLYAKDLNTGEVALVSIGSDGAPANLGSAFGRFSFLRVSATHTGRYVFYDDRFDGYVDDDTNANLDIFVADLDPDVDGDFFNTEPVIRRVSVAADGAEGIGGGTTGGSRYPSASRDGLFVTFQTDHTNLFGDDANGAKDAVLVRFAGISAEGTIDFSNLTTIPLGVDDQGVVAALGSEHPTIDRTGRAVVFTTSANLLQSDSNNEGVDSDVYRSTGFLENWQNRVLTLVSVDATGAPSAGRIAPNHAPGVADYTAEGDPRVAYLADKAAIADGDINGSTDLFVNADDVEAINWLGSNVPTTQNVLEGGLTPNGAFAWWVTIEEYSTVVGVGTGRDLYRRRIDPESETAAPQIVTAPSDITALLGESVAFGVAATGRPVPTYQWFFNGQPIDGASNSVYFLSGVSFEHEGAYSVRVSNDAGTLTTPAAQLTVTSLAPAFVEQPEALEVQQGSTAVLGARVEGLAPLTYEWRRNGIALVDDGRIVGSNSDTLRIEVTELSDAGSYTLLVSNPGGMLQSDAVELTVHSETALDGSGAIPAEFVLEQNYPNPFNANTSIRYALPQPEVVRLEVFNVLGRRVAVMADAVEPAGWHVATIDLRGFAAGTYFYRLTAGENQETRPFLLVK